MAFGRAPLQNQMSAIKISTHFLVTSGCRPATKILLALKTSAGSRIKNITQHMEFKIVRHKTYLQQKIMRASYYGGLQTFYWFELLPRIRNSFLTLSNSVSLLLFHWIMFWTYSNETFVALLNCKTRMVLLIHTRRLSSVKLYCNRQTDIISSYSRQSEAEYLSGLWYSANVLLKVLSSLNFSNSV